MVPFGTTHNFRVSYLLVIMLWPYQSLDDRIKIRKEAQGLEEWREASKD